MKLGNLIAAALTVLLALPAFAFNREGGGGDDAGIDFQVAIIKAVNQFKKQDPKAAAELSQQISMQDLSRIKVIMSDDTQVVQTPEGNQVSVAINYPHEMTIVVNRARWIAIGRPEIREAIALHEFLSLTGKEWTGGYRYSGAFAATYKVSTKAIATGQDDVGKIMSQADGNGPAKEKAVYEHYKSACAVDASAIEANYAIALAAIARRWADPDFSGANRFELFEHACGDYSLLVEMRKNYSSACRFVFDQKMARRSTEITTLIINLQEATLGQHGCN